MLVSIGTSTRALPLLVHGGLFRDRSIPLSNHLEIYPFRKPPNVASNPRVYLVLQTRNKGSSQWFPPSPVPVHYPSVHPNLPDFHLSSPFARCA